MIKNHTMGSLFDGSGGFPLAASICGIEPKWAAEVEPYPIAVTKSRFPNMKHLGDVSKVNGAEIEPVDVITAGSPCQDLSVAGKRAGLKHESNGDEETTRSGLFMEFIRIIKEMREATNGDYPRFALWENVPGAFSSNKGEDFRIVLEEFIKIIEPTAVMPEVPKNGWPYADSYCGDGWSLAYRVFDAQYWGKSVRDADSGTLLVRGTPQRRRRIHLVADFGGQCARKVLFECEGLRGNLEESGAQREAVAADAERGFGADDREGKGFDGYNGDLTGDVSATLGVNCGMTTGRNGIIEQHGLYASSGSGGQTAACLYAAYGTKWNGNGGAYSGENFVIEKAQRAVTLEPGIAAREGGHIYEGVSGTLRANAGDNQMAVAYSPVAVDTYNQTLSDTAASIRAAASDVDHVGAVCYALDQQGGKGGANYAADVMPTLCSDSHGTPHAVCYGISSYDSNAMKSSNPHSGVYEATTSRTLDLNGGNPACNQGGIAVVCAAGFCTEHSAQSRGVGYEEEVAPTLRAGVTPALCVKTYDDADGVNVLTPWDSQGNQVTDGTGNHAYPTLRGCGGAGYQAGYVLAKTYESHPMDSRIKEIEDDVSPTVSVKWHKGAADTPLVCEAKTWDARGNGDGETVSTLTGDHENRITDYTSILCMATQQGGAEIAENLCPTITAAAGMSGNNQPVICLQGNGIGRTDENGCAGKGWNDEACYTLNTIDRPAVAYACSSKQQSLAVTENTANTLGANDYKEPQAVAYGINGDVAGTLDASYYKGCGMRQGTEREVIYALDRASFNQGQNAQYDFEITDSGINSTIVAKGPSAVAYETKVRYIVRRLTPTECARLQGFPDKWGHPDRKDTFTDEEYAFWLDVRNTHAAINGKAVKEYTREQMLNWYSKLHTDSAEYKMWGNGIALPPALYCMKGIAEVLNDPR